MSTAIVPYASRSRVRKSASRSPSRVRSSASRVRSSASRVRKSASRSRSYTRRTATKVSVTRMLKVKRKYDVLLKLYEEHKNARIPDGVVIYKGKNSVMAEFPIKLNGNENKVFDVKGYKFSFTIKRITLCPVDDRHRTVYLSVPISAVGTYYYPYCKYLITCRVVSITEKAMNLKY
jgi:hypothetical protein